VVSFLIICVYRFFTWQTAPKNLEWELFPLPKNIIDKAFIMLKEILFMDLIRNHNKKLWFQSIIMHYGFYLMVIWGFLVILGFNASGIGLLASYLMLCGSLLLFLSRLMIKNLRIISTSKQYFNLIFIFLVSLSFIFVGFFDIFKSDFLYTILAFNMGNAVMNHNLIFYIAFFAMEIFIIYVPSSSMVHFFAKYFTWDKIRWGNH
jgi:nitrate reductase gamma subunit